MEYTGAMPETTPIVDILRDATESYDGFDLSTPEGWLAMFEYKSNDYGFMDLVDSLDEYGQANPIMWRDGVVGNGHHRLTAAIWLGWDTIVTTRQQSWDDYDPCCPPQHKVKVRN